MIDAFAGSNAAFANLNDTFKSIRQEDRQAKLDDLNAQSARQQLAMGNLKLNEAQRQTDDAASLRAKLAGVQPTTETTITPAKVDAGTAAQMLGGSVAPGSQYLNTPQTAPNPLQGEMQAAGLAEPPQVDASQFPAESQPKASPTVQAYNEGRVQTTTREPNYYKVIIQHAKETGNTELLQKTTQDLMKHATDLTAISGNPSESVKFLNETLGMSMSTQKAGKFDFIKDGDGNTIGIFMEDRVRSDIANGIDPHTAVQNGTINMGQDGTAGQKLAAYMTTNPDISFRDAMSYMGQHGIDPSGKGVAKILETLRRADENKAADLRAEKNRIAADDRQNKQLAAADERLNRTLAAADRRSERAEQLKKTGKPLPAGQLESLSESANLIKTLDEAKDLSLKVNTGFISGRVQSVGQKVGAAGKDFNQFKQKLSTVENIMLKLRSGAAVTESEYARFKNEMPSVNDDEQTRDVKLANSVAYARELLNGKIDTYQEGGYKVPTGLITRSQSKEVRKQQPASKSNAPIVTKGGFKVTVVP